MDSLSEELPEGSVDTSMDSFPDAVLVPVVVVRGAGGSLGVVVVQGGDEEEGVEEELEHSTDDSHGGLASPLFCHSLSGGGATEAVTNPVAGINLDARESERCSSGGGRRRKSAVIIQTVLEGGAAYNRLIPGIIGVSAQQTHSRYY